MAHSLVGHLNWSGIEFMPLFTLFFLLMLKDKKWYSMVGASISFVLMLFVGDPEQGIISLLLIALLLVISLFSKEGRRNVISGKFLISAACSILLILIIGSPFFVPIAIGVMHGALSEATANAASLSGHMVWSVPLLSFILPSPYNNLFTPLSNGYVSVYIADAEERIAYLGWVALFLVFAAITLHATKRRLGEMLPWIVVAFVFAWLATGPYLEMGALPSQINTAASIPGPYLLYMAIPILNIIREPASFDVIVMLCMAVLAGLRIQQS